MSRFDKGERQRQIAYETLRGALKVALQLAAEELATRCDGPNLRAMQRVTRALENSFDPYACATREAADAVMALIGDLADATVTPDPDEELREGQHQ